MATPPLSASVEDNRDRAVVDEADAHAGAEDARRQVERLMFRTAWKVREMIDRGEVDPHGGLSRVAWTPEALEHVASAETREASQAGEVTRTGDEPS
jgi:hypothetical protein